MNPTEEEKVFFTLAKFAKNHPDIAELIVSYFSEKREKMRKALESPMGTHGDHVNAGRAQAFHEASKIFKDAAKGVENIQNRSQAG